LCAGIFMLGGGIVILLLVRPDAAFHDLGMRVGISLLGLGGIGYFATTLWTSLVVRCPRCRKFIFSLDDPCPEEKKFYCKRCDVNWSIGIVAVGYD